MKNLLQRIANTLYINTQNIEGVGILNGKIGVAIFFYHYHKYSNNLIYSDFADSLLDEMLESIERRHFSPDFSTGLTGFGWGIEYLIKNRFAEGNSDELLEDIDKKIINWFETLKKSKDNNKYKAYTSDSALFSIGLYLSSRFSNGNINNRKLKSGNLALAICHEMLNTENEYFLSFYNSIIYSQSVFSENGVCKIDDSLDVKRKLLSRIERCLINKKYTFHDLVTFQNLIIPIGYPKKDKLINYISPLLNNDSTSIIDNIGDVGQKLLYFNDSKYNKIDINAASKYLDEVITNMSLDNFTINKGLAGLGLGILRAYG